MGTPFISLVIPVYNVGPFVERSVKSIIDQDYNDFEIIVVDDCGTDGSIDIVVRLLDSSHLKSCYRVVRHEKNMGLAAGRQSGLEVCRGEYILNVDSDDYFEPTMLSSIAKAAESGADMVIFDFYRRYSSKSLYVKASADADIDTKEGVYEYLCEVMESRRPTCVWNKLIKRSLFIDNGVVFYSKMADDLSVIPKLIWLSTKIVFVREPLVNYVMYNSSSISYSIKHIRSIAYALEELKIFFGSGYERISAAILRYETITVRKYLIHRDGGLKGVLDLPIYRSLEDSAKNGVIAEPKYHYRLLLMLFFKCREKIGFRLYLKLLRIFSS